MPRKATVAAVMTAAAALLVSWWYTAGQEDDRFLFQPVQGRNNTVLFVTEQHPGFCNVHLATVYALLANHPDVEIHYASFPKNAKRVERISALAAAQGGTTQETDSNREKDVRFHVLDGLGYADAMARVIDGQTGVIHAPGLAGADFLAKNLNHFLAPWSAAEYEALYLALARLIADVDPAVVVIDSFFSPGIDAARNGRRLHALVTPNVFSQDMPAAQPPWTLFWKYPAVGTGFPYPVPWHLIPANVYANFKIVRGMLNMPAIAAKKKLLREAGIKRPIDFLGLYRPDVPWLTQTLPGAHLPLAVLPANVTRTGPINLAGLEATDDADAAREELLDWVGRMPTVMISLGSAFTYTEPRARAMLTAVQSVLREADVQVLWKMDRNKDAVFDYSFVEAAVRASSGRLRIEKWLAVEPPTLAQNDNIVAFVHHGGAGCFHDALGAGTPQVILPLWADLYDIAQLTDYLGIGVWACHETSPDWSAECIQQGILRVVKDSPASALMAEKAASFGAAAKKMLGRDVAAQEIARLAASGHS